MIRSNHHDHRRDNRPCARLLLNETLQLHAHVLLQERFIGKRLPRRAFYCRHYNSLRIFEQIISVSAEPISSAQSAHAARHDLRLTFEFSSLSIDSHHNRHCTLLRQLLALAHSLAVDLLESTLVNKRALDLTLVDYGSTLPIQLQHIAILNQNDVVF